MLPKLQQSSLATSLRRDNLASQIQCNSPITQVKISLKESSISKTTKHTNHGKINMPLKTLTAPLVISPKNTCLNKKSKMSTTNRFMNIRCLGPLLNTRNLMEMVGEAQVYWVKSKSFKSLFPNLEHL